MTSKRREFLATVSVALASATAFARKGDTDEVLRSFLVPHVLRLETLDKFLDSNARMWAKFEPELGYLLRNSVVRDGVDGCYTLSRYQKTGQRRQVNFPDQPCRINTYGDSFTQGHQVIDGETWQAYAIKDAIRDWLDPAPPAYQDSDEPLIRFQGYLPG